MKYEGSILARKYSFLLIVLVGLLIRLAFGKWTYPHLLDGDAQFYYEDALKILNGDFCQTYWPPGVPFISALFMRILGVSPLAILIGMTGLYCLFAWRFQILLERLNDISVANLVQLIFAVYPAFIQQSVAPLSHLPVAICMVVVADRIWNLHISPKTEWSDLLITGFAIGAGTLFRPGFILTLPVVAGFLIWKFRLRLAFIITPLIIAFLMVTGWQVWVYQCSGRWVWINDATSMNMFIGNNPYTPMYRTWWLGTHDESHNPAFIRYYHLREEVLSLPPKERNAAYTDKAQEHIREFPFIFLIRTFSRIRCFFAFDTYAGASMAKRNPIAGGLLLALDAIAYIYLGFLAIWGMVGRGSPVPGPVRKTLLLLIPAYGLPYFLAFSHPNYHLPVVPILGLFGAIALVKPVPGLFSFEGFSRKGRWFVYLAFLSFLYIQFEWLAHLIDQYVSVTA